MALIQPLRFLVPTKLVPPRPLEAESVSLLAALEGAPPQAARVAALCR